MRFRIPIVILVVAMVAVAISVMSAPVTPVKITDQSVSEKLTSMQAEIAALHTQVAADEKKLAATEDTANKARTVAGLVQIAYDHDMPALKPLPGKVAAFDGLPARVSALEALPGKLQSLDQDYRTHRHQLNNDFGFHQVGQFKDVITSGVGALTRPTSPPVH